MQCQLVPYFSSNFSLMCLDIRYSTLILSTAYLALDKTNKYLFHGFSDHVRVVWHVDDVVLAYYFGHYEFMLTENAVQSLLLLT